MSKVEIVLPISRSEHLQALFARLEHIECDTSQTSLLAYVDGDKALFEQVQQYVEQSKFATRRCVHRHGKDGKVSNVDRVARRKRIASIHNELKSLVGECDYIFGLEDDTIPHGDVLKSLLHDYSIYPYAGFIEGVELGRWRVPYVGAWRANSVYETTSIQSCLPAQEIIEEIDAGGFYCFMTKREHYVNHNFKPYGYDLLGPDVEFGFSLRQQGYKNYIDWSITCRHMQQDGTALTVLNTTIAHARIEKRRIGKLSVWEQKIDYRGELRDGT